MYNNSFGETIWSKSYNDFLIYRLDLFPNGDLAVSGRIGDYPVLMRTNDLGEPIWAKGLNHPIGNAVAYITPTVTSGNNIICSYFGYYFLLDGTGSLIWAWDDGGLPIATNDGGYAFLSVFIDTGANYITTIKKTDSNGLVEGCEPIAPCLSFEDVEVTAFSGAVYPIADVVVDTALDLTVVPINALMEDYCPPPVQEPSAEFTAPGSICAGDCFNLENLLQQNADAWTWIFDELSPASSNSQNPGEICSSTPGLYELKQIISYLGCIDSFSTIIEVVPEILPDLGNDTLICEGSSLQLDGTATNAISYLWNDQTEGPIREITTSGVYTLNASNGQCEGSSSIEVLFSKNNSRRILWI